MIIGKPSDAVRCVCTSAALVALVHNEEKAENLINSILSVNTFKEYENEIKEEFTKGTKIGSCKMTPQKFDPKN